MSVILGFICFNLISTELNAQLFEKPSYGNYLIKNAELHTITQGIMEGDILLIEGTIADIGPNLETDEEVEVIDANGQRVYPGFIDAGTRLGLSEVSSVSLTRDFNEHGNFTPYVQALTAINPNGVPIAVTRVSGVTTVLSAPSGGLFPGTAAAIHLLGYTPDQMYAGAKSVIMNFPESGKRGRWDRRTPDKVKEEYEGQMKKLNEFWEEVEQYYSLYKKGNTPENRSASLEAMLPVFNKEVPLHVEVNRAPDIIKAIEWLKDKEVEVVLTGVAEGWRVAEEIAATNWPVITGPVLQTPSRSYDKYDRPYSNPAVMQKAGIKMAIRTNETENVRNLPFNAGYAATYGLGKEQALEAITIIPAIILGLEDKIGSLEVGKLANLFICDGDPFEPKTQLSQLFIKGWKVPLENRHTQLFDQFIERSPGIDMNE